MQTTPTNFSLYHPRTAAREKLNANVAMLHVFRYLSLHPMMWFVFVYRLALFSLTGGGESVTKEKIQTNEMILTRIFFRSRNFKVINVPMKREASSMLLNFEVSI